MNTDEIIPFGKYKGQPIEVLISDEKYIDWLSAQDWFKANYPTMYKTVVINNYNEPTDTPEHNILQARFLKEDFVASLMKNIYKQYIGSGMKIKISDPDFEVNGVDVVLNFIVYEKDGGKFDYEVFDRWLIEIKPSISDDYPSVLRQVKNNMKNQKRYSDATIRSMVYTKNYTGSVELEDVKEIFRRSEILFFVDNN